MFNFPEPDFRGVWPPTSAEWALYGQVAVPMLLPDAGRFSGVISHMPVYGQVPVRGQFVSKGVEPRNQISVGDFADTVLSAYL